MCHDLTGWPEIETLKAYLRRYWLRQLHKSHVAKLCGRGYSTITHIHKRENMFSDINSSTRKLSDLTTRVEILLYYAIYILKLDTSST